MLTRAIDRERSNQAHPAFVKLIGQLCPDEALLLHHLADKEINLAEYHQDWSVKSIAWSDYPVKDLQTDARLSMYLSHLGGLNLVDYMFGTEDVSGNFPDVEDCTLLGSKARLTPFGRLFNVACEP